MSVRAKVPAIARTLLGLAFVVFGLNYFLPQPAMSADAMAFSGALFAGKVFPITKPVEIVAGLALLGNRFVPLALTLLAPIEIGILTFHVVLEPSGLPLIVIPIALTVYLAWSLREPHRRLSSGSTTLCTPPPPPTCSAGTGLHRRRPTYAR